MPLGAGVGYILEDMNKQSAPYRDSKKKKKKKKEKDAGEGQDDGGSSAMVVELYKKRFQPEIKAFVKWSKV
jgi:hypothetical protein